VPRGRGTRPTSERVREAMFSALDSRGVIAGARVLDLYAGSGALGLEAASRGAASVVLVEAARPAVTAARQNVAALGLDQVVVEPGTVERFLSGPGAPMDLVLLDPPYDLAERALAAVLAALVERGWLAPGAQVVLERAARSPEPAWPPGLARTGVREHGDTAVWTAAPVEEARRC